MNLDELPDGTRVFIDANLLIYGLRRTSCQCLGLLARCNASAVEGVITTVVVAEYGHRRMMEEARARGLVGSNPARALAGHPELVRQLTTSASEVRALLGGGLSVMPVLPDDFHVALEFQRQFGLLTNDSLNLAVARRLGLTALATADQGFDAVHGFMVYRPSDLVRP
jgi:predicted nucleic acid-binding protein